MIKVNFISVAPESATGAVTVAFFEDHVSTKQWYNVTDPEKEYEALFPKVVRDFVAAGAQFVFTTTKQVDVLREKDRVSITELDDIKEENK